MTREDIESACPPLELSEELAKFCGIIDPNHIPLLQHILSQYDVKAIEDLLHRRGIGHNFPQEISEAGMLSPDEQIRLWGLTEY